MSQCSNGSEEVAGFATPTIVPGRPLYTGKRPLNGTEIRWPLPAHERTVREFAVVRQKRSLGIAVQPRSRTAVPTWCRRAFPSPLPEAGPPARLDTVHPETGTAGAGPGIRRLLAPVRAVRKILAAWWIRRPLPIGTLVALHRAGP